MSPAEVTVVLSLDESLKAAVTSRILGAFPEVRFAPDSDHSHSAHDCCSSGECTGSSTRTIAVIDSETLLQNFQATDSDVAETLAQQIESADCVVLIPAAEAARTLIQSLNPGALILEGAPESLDPSQMLMGTTLDEGPAGKKSSAHTFRARKPFHPERFFEALQANWQGTLRSKGHFWLASRPDQMGLWSQAGSSASIEAAGPWLAAIPQEQWQEHWDLDSESLAEVQANWDPQFGDRGQELTLVGAPEGLLKVLESCLLTDEELALGRNYWQNSSDPFPAWT